MAAGRLHTQVNAHSGTYVVEAGVEDSRGIWLLKAVGSEKPCAVAVFPEFGMAYAPNHYGLLSHVTVDGPEAVSPVMVTHDVLRGVKDEGVVPKPKMKERDNFWTRHAPKWFPVLPGTRQTDVESRVQDER